MGKAPDKNSTDSKKPYIKPELKRVVLRAEEAVLGACKKTGASGPGSANCQIPSACSTIGS